MRLIKIVLILAIFTPVIGFAQQQSSLDSKKVIAKYNSMDKDRSGTVSKAEADAEGMSGPTFAKIDSNKDGAISQSEFIAGMAAGYWTGGGKWE